MHKLFYPLLCLTLTAALLAGCSAVPVQSGSNAGSLNSSFDRNKISTDLVAANTRFAFTMFKQLNQEDGEQNILISPLSISTALAMTYQGAAGSTKEAMAKALGYTGLEDITVNHSYQNLIPYLNGLDDKVKLNVGNSVWVREGEEIKPDFLTVNRDIFYAPTISLDFSKDEAAAQINQWIAEATDQKITKMVDSPIESDVVMYLINAIYFKGDWAEQFEPEKTVQTKFAAGDGKTDEVRMMSRTGKVEYGEGENFQAVRLPYGGGKAAMYCILPKEGLAINDFVLSLDAGRWQAIKDSLAERDELLVQLPRFKLEYGIKNLNESLAALGMGEAFTAQADFSRMGNQIYISRVLHKAIIEVNEEGSEVAAATGVEVQKISAQTLAFIANRPFLFVIADDQTGTVLFMGKLSEVRQ
ncbi:proteinase inhibitor I4 serpin [Syntrophobotulus glycolicus DSM 8271]|uniref:Proteinase inhibitor I4 serpin n=1 Tax=Syntrophobotulus glycolicus (strain DSM 8271 / FlGlyR) TaxID=645991 RepID=F0SWY2_SYNGF|nr:serpin family protein [Syntrophobotulus glycolicus]ADY55765.1 proteinase inhibitor I4 serpin [Syntrophobotulus glycolicus DSM 8271]